VDRERHSVEPAADAEHAVDLPASGGADHPGVRNPIAGKAAASRSGFTPDVLVAGRGSSVVKARPVEFRGRRGGALRFVGDHDGAGPDRHGAVDRLGAEAWWR